MFPPKQPRVDEVMYAGMFALNERNWPQPAIPTTGPWSQLAVAPEAGTPFGKQALAAIFAGRELWGEPALDGWRRVELDKVYGELWFCGFPGRVPMCLAVQPSRIETRIDETALWAIAWDLERSDRIRRDSARGTYTLRRTRRAMVWQEAHGIGCEGATRACDPIAVGAGLQPIGEPSTHDQTRSMVATELETKPHLWIRCFPEPAIRIVAYADVAARRMQRAPAAEAPTDRRLGVEETVEVTAPDPTVYDLFTGEALGTLSVLRQDRSNVLWRFGDDHDAIQVRGALTGHGYCGDSRAHD